MSTHTRILKCDIKHCMDIINDPITYNITGYEDIKQISESVYIQYFGNNKDLAMQYTIKQSPIHDRVEIELTNINTYKNTETIIFEFTQINPNELSLYVQDELIDLEKDHAFLNKFLRALKANEESINQILNRIEKFI